MSVTPSVLMFLHRLLSINTSLDHIITKLYPHCLFGHKHTKTHSPPPHQYNVPSYYVIYQFSKHLTTPTPRGQFPHRTTSTCPALSRPPPAAPDSTCPPYLGGLHPTPKNAISRAQQIMLSSSEQLLLAIDFGNTPCLSHRHIVHALFLHHLLPQHLHQLQ